MSRALAAAAAAAVCCVVFLSSSAARAQVIYEPVRSQHDAGNGARYYYGGVDPRVHALARLAPGCRAHAYGTNLHAFDGGNSFNQPSPMSDRTPVFTDCIPYQDARWFGYTAADAENEARANAARYFRKADALDNAIVFPDGTRVVPATAPRVMPMAGPMYVPAPSSRYGNRGQIIIIPRNLLDRPLKSFEKKQPEKVAAAK